MIADSVVGRKYTKPISSEKIKEAVKETISSKVATSQIDPVYNTINQSFESWNKEGAKKVSQLKELLRQNIRDKNTFKFSESILDQFIETYLSRTLGIMINKIHRDDASYRHFLDTTVQETATVLDRGLTGQEPMWGLFLEEKMQSGKTELFLALIFVKLSDDILWIPTVPSEAKLDNGEVLKQVDFSKMFQPIYEDAIPNKQDRGMVRVTGPRGGEHLCGEVYTTKKRDTFKEKKLPLQNEYSMEIFVKQ